MPASKSKGTAGAAKLYRDFMGFPPGKKRKVKLPGVNSTAALVKLGEGISIAYRSSKIIEPEDRGTKHDYIHKFKKRWTLASDPGGTYLVIFPDPYSGKKVVRPEGVID